AGQDGVLHGSRAYTLRRQRRDLAQLRQVRHQPDEAATELHVDERPQAIADVVEVVYAERERHAATGPEQVHDDGHAVTSDVLEQDGGPALLHGPVGDLGRFQVRRHQLGDPPELAQTLESGDELPQVRA